MPCLSLECGNSELKKNLQKYQENYKSLTLVKIAQGHYVGLHDSFKLQELVGNAALW